MSLKSAFNQEKLPMKTVQRNINQRKSLSSKFLKVAKAFRKRGRRPADLPDRATLPVPPVVGGKVSK